MTEPFVMPQAAWRATLAGKDLTDKMAPRLISLSLTEKRGNEADMLEIVLDDRDGLLDIPASGVKLRVFIGWVKGTGVPIGLIDKGEFLVDEACAAGPPDKITIRARSANLTGAFALRRERSFVDKTVADVIGTIAGDNSLIARIDPDLAAKFISALGTGAKSDSVLLKEMGKTFDAVATVKAGYLIFSKIGKGATATGKTIPVDTIDRRQTGPFNYTRADRGQYDGVEAQYHDKDSASRHTISAGHSGSGQLKRLRKVYASAKAAQHAVDSELSRMKRGKAKMDFSLALGRPDYFPDRPIQVTGYKNAINAHTWLIEEATHEMNGTGGLVTRLRLEAKT
ncbi:MAG: phage late control D family protein [Asticcacaulis sp.]